LPNRELFYDRLQLALTKAEREQSQFALLYLDLDKFKQINDNYGHHIGDELLQHTAQRIQCCLRSSDTVARLGGDEFVILLQQVDSEDLAMLLAEKIRQALNQPFVLANNALQVQPSVGIALYPQHSNEAQALMRSADNAMYLAKKAGGNRIMLSGAAVVKRRVTTPAEPV
jgi:diguanylate cyclase (GGDEF)-like protein